MAKKKKKMPGLNTSSTADISFMLLIFFLITTSMDTDTGLVRKLPPPPDKNQEKAQIDVKQRNILNIQINAGGQARINHGEGNFEPLDIDYQKLTAPALKDKAKDFIKNESNAPHLPELKVVQTDNMKLCGIPPMNITANHVISVQTDRGTPYWIYFLIQNELVAAYNELRNEFSLKHFHCEYQYLTDDQKAAVRDVYPQKISEAEPKDYSSKK